MLTDKKTYGEFFDHWFTPQIAQIYLKEGNKGGARTYLNEQGEFVIFPVPDYWSTLSKDEKQVLITEFGGKEEAQNIVRVIATGNLVTHEIAHLYESPFLPLLFSESGAYYYANDVALFKSWDRTTTDNSKRAAEFYATLIDKYGDDVHRVFFGQKVDAEIKIKILDECTKEAQKRVFPDLHLESS